MGAQVFTCFCQWYSDIFWYMCFKRNDRLLTLMQLWSPNRLINRRLVSALFWRKSHRIILLYFGVLPLLSVQSLPVALDPNWQINLKIDYFPTNSTVTLSHCWTKSSVSSNTFQTQQQNKNSPLTFTVSDKVCQPYARVPDCPSASTVFPSVDKKKRHTSIKGTAMTPIQTCT